MATAAFKSTTKRTPVGTSSASSTDDSGSSNRNSSAHRRARSLSRFPRRLHPHDSANDLDEFPAPRGKFVNTVRGSGFPEISLDDLAVEFFESANRGRLASSRHSEPSPAGGAAASQRRGRSVSRKGSAASNDARGNVGNSASGGGRIVSDASSRRRRSLSVVRYQISDSESDPDHSQNVKSRINVKTTNIGNKVMHKPVASDQRSGLRRSLSQKDLRPYDGYSSQSSVLTDDEEAGAHLNKNGFENTRASYAQKKAGHYDNDRGFHKATRKELRHAADDINMQIENVVTKPRTSTLATVDRLLSNNSDVIQAVSGSRRNYETELELSEKRKQDLLAEIVLEEQRGRELSKIVKQLVPTKNNAVQKPSRPRKRSNDRSNMSKRLTEEAERYIEDFISNVEDTDISSLDGERSDASSSIGGLIKLETYNSPSIPRSLPVEMDGVTLPWLQWETSNDGSPITSLNKEISQTPEESSRSVSSRGSWTPNELLANVGKDLGSKFGESYSYQSQSFSAASKGLKYEIVEYLQQKNTEDLLIERWMQQRRIDSGSLLLCNLRLF